MDKTETIARAIPARLPGLLAGVAWIALIPGAVLMQGAALAQGTAPAQDAASSVTLDELQVAGRGGGIAVERATGPVRGYVATRSASGSKTDTPIIETPQSISVVPARQIRDTGAQSFTDTLAYTPGVSANPGLGRTSDSFFIRGFNVATGNGGLLRDGMKLSSGVYEGTQEPYGLERLEVLKGAASILYGQLTPGGVINAISKRPLSEPFREMNYTVGSYGRKEVSGDFSGPLTPDGAWSYRLTGLFRDSGTFIDFTPDDKRYIAPALTWRPSADTSVTLLGYYQEIRTAHQPPLPALGTLVNNPPFGRFPVNRFYGEPSFDKFDSRSGAIGYLVDHAFSDAVRLRHALRYYQAGVDWDYVTVPSLQANRQIVNRSVSSRNENATGVTSDTSLEVKFATGPVAHTLLTGIDYYRAFLNSERYQTGTVGSLNVYNPVYGLTTPQPNFRVNTGSKLLLDQVGLYAQDQIKFDRFVLLLGGRQDFAKTQNLAYLTGARIEQNDSAFSGRAGLVYLADYGVAPYVSYSQSFATFAQTDRGGNPFQPTTGEQYEGGVRWQIPDADTLISGAVYQINQKNALVPDPVNTAFSIQTGEVRSQGFEIEGRTNFGPLQLVASYSYTDARTTKTTIPANLNQRIATVPYHLASAFGTYDIGVFGVPGLRLGGGVRYIGSANIPGFALDTKETTLFDLVGLYDFGAADPSLAGWRAQLNIRNLADRIYVTCATGSACVYNEPRNVFGTISYRW
ncbi:TonB-dependent siderophore receptor [Methylobacterium sp. J-068]|uniref:TonB-dependent siderophore receptor n=1 Tax=Methylobacterium sp. J-068 TaxID=2836649 RepID=UPI001FBA5C5D|nr:TonB-dependent siderophore receptor [Methylobacterium sp. J-068]MCJ2036123.1 TonB-dependent siderophore receptor [Methylobacterium sp. J-068]